MVTFFDGGSSEGRLVCPASALPKDRRHRTARRSGSQQSGSVSACETQIKSSSILCWQAVKPDKRIVSDKSFVPGPYSPLEA
jgi:hypothetical protein